MPKTAVYKKNRFEFWQNNIGFPWKIDPLQTKAISQTVQQGLNGLSRASIAAFDLSHRPAAFFRAQLVHAETISALESKAKSTAGDASEALCGPRWPKPAGQSAPAYPELSALVGSAVPDLRGLFLRGLGGNSAALGVQQGDAVKAHTHNTVAGSWTAWLGEGHSSHSHYTFAMGGGGQTTASGGVENRPINMAVRYLVRARP